MPANQHKHWFLAFSIGCGNILVIKFTIKIFLQVEWDTKGGECFGKGKCENNW